MVKCLNPFETFRRAVLSVPREIITLEWVEELLKRTYGLTIEQLPARRQVFQDIKDMLEAINNSETGASQALAVGKILGINLYPSFVPKTVAQRVAAKVLGGNS